MEKIKLDLNGQLSSQISGFLERMNYLTLSKETLAHHLREKSNSLDKKESLIFARLKTALMVMADLVSHGWKIEIKGAGKTDPNIENIIEMVLPEIIKSSQDTESKREQIKASLMIGVHKQLNSKGTSGFIEKMHATTRSTQPIDLLIDDAGDLMSCLENAPSSKNDYLKGVVDPYLQVADTNTRDDFTNHRLSDIWKYFRHTWSLEYKTNPGRSMGFLIRNKARPNHPIIGISMLASPVLGLGPRDEEMKLTKESFISWLQEKRLNLTQLIELIDRDIERSLRYVKWDDFISSKEISRPNLKVIQKINYFYERSSKLKNDYQKNESDEAADKQLFISKRAVKLKKLLERRMELKDLKAEAKKYDLKISDCNNNQHFLKIIKGFVNARRTEIMSSDVMDMNVCGAVAPYNKLIGGKLVALLMASKETYNLFNKKYANSESEIATKIAGRNIRKKSDLKCITTTSIYGTQSSQYNRLKLIMNSGKRQQALEFKKLKKPSEGYGTFHFSQETMNVLDDYLKTSGRNSKIKYKFGEGASPRLRRLRESMNYLGFREDAFFQHKQYRIIYLLNLYNLSLPDVIYGLKDVKPSLFSSAQISKAWRDRWLEQRIQNPKIQQSMKETKKEDGYLTHKISPSSQDLFNKQETK